MRPITKKDSSLSFACALIAIATLASGCTRNETETRRQTERRTEQKTETQPAQPVQPGQPAQPAQPDQPGQPGVAGEGMSHLEACRTECPNAKTDLEAHECASNLESLPGFSQTQCGRFHFQHKQQPGTQGQEY